MLSSIVERLRDQSIQAFWGVDPKNWEVLIKDFKGNKNDIHFVCGAFSMWTPTF